VPTGKFLVRQLGGEADARRLEDTLRAVAGIHGATASAASRCVEVDFEDDRVAITDIADAAARAGFELRLAG
jgi:copper chaperone CopZ